MRIAITGGTGFIGRHLARELVAHGHEVVLIARGLDRRDPSAYAIPNTHFFSADLSKCRGAHPRVFGLWSEQIRRGLPEAASFGLRDLRCCAR
ncbi:MAG: NAD(P)-dependent oxidoreductase [Candidatus Acidiferrales bacterium]|jgi:nucleoside-diphosphate-sugar epimerase